MPDVKVTDKKDDVKEERVRTPDNLTSREVVTLLAFALGAGKNADDWIASLNENENVW